MGGGGNDDAQHGEGGGQWGMRGMLVEVLDGTVDDQIWHQYNARDCLLSQQRYDSAWAFLLAVRECMLTSGGDCVEEWAIQKNMTPYNNQQNISNGNKMNGHE